MGINNIIQTARDYLADRIKARSLFLAGCSLLLGGACMACVDDNSECIEDRPGFQQGNDVWMAFQVKSMKGPTKEKGTRADGAGHPEEPGSPEENAINRGENAINADNGEMSLFLFDDKMRCLKIFDRSDYSITTSSAGETTRNLVVKVNKDYFSYATGDNVEFYFMLIVNQNGLGEAFERFSPDIWMKTPYAISQGLTSFSYSGSRTATEIDGNPTVAWTPDGKTRFIPMSGIGKMTMPRTALETGSYSFDSPFTDDSNVINLQRNLAKIRVLDAVELNNELSPKKQINKVELLGFNLKGAFLPAYENWYMREGSTDLSGFTGTSDIEDATDKEGWFQSGVSGDVTDYRGYLDLRPSGERKTFDKDGKRYTEFYCYVPECLLKFSEMVLKVTIDRQDKSSAGKGDPSDGEEGSIVKGFRLIDIPFDSKTKANIVRNHIYEYIVDLKEGVNLDVNLKVADWNDRSLTLDYSETAGISAPTQWAPRTYQSFDPSSGQIVTLPWTEGGTRSAAKAVISLSTPVNATWTARLITTSGNQGAFMFIDNGGQLVDELTGTIDGHTADLLITTVNPNPSVTSTARLMITVRLANGKYIEANICGADAGYKNFTIIQNQQ